MQQHSLSSYGETATIAPSYHEFGWAGIIYDIEQCSMDGLCMLRETPGNHIGARPRNRTDRDVALFQCRKAILQWDATNRHAPRSISAVLRSGCRAATVTWEQPIVMHPANAEVAVLPLPSMTAFG